jgi:monoamine oxidase
MKMQAIAEMNYEPAHKTFFFLKDRFWEMGDEHTRIVGGGSSTDLPEIGVYYPSDHAVPVWGMPNAWTLRPGASPKDMGVLLASYNLGQDSVRMGNRAPELITCDVQRDIERIHGLPWGYLDDKIISYESLLWSRVQYIWGAFCFAKPQDKILFSYEVTRPEMGNRIFFAGEHISQKHAWQQGALQTGMQAANDIAEVIRSSRV